MSTPIYFESKARWLQAEAEQWLSAHLEATAAAEVEKYVREYREVASALADLDLLMAAGTTPPGFESMKGEWSKKRQRLFDAMGRAGETWLQIADGVALWAYRPQELSRSDLVLAAQSMQALGKRSWTVEPAVDPAEFQRRWKAAGEPTASSDKPSPSA